MLPSGHPGWPPHVEKRLRLARERRSYGLTRGNSLTVVSQAVDAIDAARRSTSARRQEMSYFRRAAHVQQIENGSDGLGTMKPIKSATSTNTTRRKDLESQSSYATHSRNKYGRLRADRKRDKCFIDPCW